MLFDTHAHYDDKQFSQDREQVISCLPENGVSLVVNLGSDLKTSKASVDLAQNFPFVYAAVGIHPHSAQTFSQSALNEIEKLASSNRVKAIGEIGLDYYYDFSPREQQKEAFSAQLDLACKLGLPVVVHDRDAHEDTMDIIKNHRATGVFHCYSGSLEMAKVLLDLGWYLSFNGAITFKNAKKALDVISYMPLDKIMIETDCPYLTPEPFRGRRNDSSYVKLVAEKIAMLRGLTFEQTAELTMQNGKKLFNII